MRNIDCRHGHQSEKAIIDALLKISEIVQKTEKYRQDLNTTKKVKSMKKTFDDGDYLEGENDITQQVPVPPPMRTLDPYVLGFNDESCRRGTNSNHKSLGESDNSQRLDVEKEHNALHISNEYKRSCKRRSDARMSVSSFPIDGPYRKKSSIHQRTGSSIMERQPIRESSSKIENQKTIMNSDSTATTVAHDDVSSASIMIPTCPVIKVITEEPMLPKSSIGMKDDNNSYLTLDEYLKSHLLSAIDHESSQRNCKTQLITLTKSQTEKLINEFDLKKNASDLQSYEKQHESAVVAMKVGDYSVSYSIYTNLLHEHRYDYKLKSDILASRAAALLLDQKYFDAIDDCTQAIAFNQWNKLAYVVRGACWMIKQEYSRAVEDYSKLFHFFDQSQHSLDLLNLAYDKLTLSKNVMKDGNNNRIKSSMGTSMNPKGMVSSASFIQPTVYFPAPFQTCCRSYDEKTSITGEDLKQTNNMISNGSLTSQQTVMTNQSLVSTDHLLPR